MLRKDLIYGMDKHSMDIAKQREIISRGLLEQRKLLAKKAIKIGMRHPVNRKVSTKPRGCGCSQHR
jgi:hypothetical protein